MKLDDFTYPPKLPPRQGGRALTDAEIAGRLAKIAEFYILNGVFPDVTTLGEIWNLSGPSVFNTLNILAEKDMINLYIRHSHTLIGMTMFQLEQVNLDGSADES